MEAANYGILSLIPLALTLLLAFWKKDAVFALFILAVVDTIEPYKIYSSKAADRDAVRIWKSIDIRSEEHTSELQSR